jgi:hypothetical protein
VAVAVASPVDPHRGDSALSGIVTWSLPGRPPQPRGRQLLLLIGLDGTPTKGVRYRVRAARDGRYEFKDVVAGPYQLTDAIAGQPTWRLRVVLETGRDAVLDLSADNSAGVRDDFPDTALRSTTAITAPPSRSARDASPGGPRTTPTSTEGN